MFNGMLDFKNIQRNELQQDGAQLGLLFIVPGGVTIQKVVNSKDEGVHGLSLQMQG
jgi:hypothetical protein